MTDQTVTPVTPADQHEARRWRTREVLMNGEERLYQESEATSRHRLTEMIRTEGYVGDHDTLTVGPWFEVAVSEDGTRLLVVDEDDPTAPLSNARARDWSMTAFLRIADDANLVLLPTLLRYDVPEPVATTGGDIRVRHNLAADDVTVMTELVDGTMSVPPVYSDLDGHQTEVNILPGTRRVYVQPAAPDGQTPG